MSNKRKPVFFTADLHLGHARSIEYDKRPFKDVEHMFEALVVRFNNTVPTNGITYFLGDVGIDTHSVQNFLRQTHGTKLLIVGNHDKGYNAMYEAGFDAVMHGAVIYVGKQRVTLSHCPLLGVYREDTSNYTKTGADLVTDNWHGENRPKHRACSTPDNGQFHISGHIHSGPNKKEATKILGRQFDVGVCANNYAPVSLSTIESWINSFPNK